MKERFIRQITEAGRAIWEIKLFEIAMSTVICFLAFSILLTVVGSNIIWALITSAVYFLIILFRSAMKSDIVSTIEKKNKHLDERLKTAFDNQNKENLVVSHLLTDVSSDMENVETSAFMDEKAVTSKVVMVIVMIFLMLFLTVIDFKGRLSNVIDLNSLMNDIGNSLREKRLEYERAIAGEEGWEASNLTTEKEREKLGAEPGGDRPGFHMGPIPGSGGGVGSDDLREIYGEASSTVINGEELDFNLRPDYGGEIDMEETDARRQQVNALGSESADASETCEECAVGPEYEALVKRYFEKILGE